MQGDDLRARLRSESGRNYCRCNAAHAREDIKRVEERTGTDLGAVVRLDKAPYRAAGDVPVASLQPVRPNGKKPVLLEEEGMFLLFRGVCAIALAQTFAILTPSSPRNNHFQCQVINFGSYFCICLTARKCSRDQRTNWARFGC